MGKRVALCAVSQIKNDGDYWYLRFQNMLLPCLESILEQTGVTFDLEKGIRNIVTCSDDVYDARTISDNGVTDVVGAHFRGEEKMAQESLNGLGYAMSCILSGHDDVVLYIGNCKESQTESRLMNTNLSFDPFYSRPLGLDFLNANAFQEREYLNTSGLTEQHLAKIVVRSRKKAKKNQYARDNEPVTLKDVMKSPMIADPIRKLHQYPITDWAFGMLLCCEERAKEFTDNPVWITGFGNCIDSYFLGDKELTSNFPLKKAAQRAYAMAGIKDPKKDFNVVELMDSFAYELPLWAEGTGIIDEGKGAEWIDGNGPDDQNVNLSGGMLNGNPIMLGGAARAIECFLQLRGEAEKRQVKGAKRALAHGTYGAAGQHHAVVILEK
jgi:acetyl-CoA C-acetyltransferase